jgi:hypothetical protein
MQERDCFRKRPLIEVRFQTISNRVQNSLPPRASEYAKGGQNFSGRALMELCDTADLAIVNGRTLGDANGSYTHHSATTGKDNLGGHSLVDYFVADRKMFQDCIKNLGVSNIVINSDHSYLLLEIELKVSCHLDDESSVRNPRAAPRRFQLGEEKHEEHMLNDPRLDCRHLKDESDALHTAVLVQNTIFDVATKCFGKKPPNLKATFPSNEWYDREYKELQTRYIGLVRSGAGTEERMAARKAYRTPWIGVRNRKAYRTPW